MPEDTPDPTPRLTGHDCIQACLRTLDGSPGVYRMLDAESRVLYVGKARNLRARVSNYARPGNHSARIERMIRETAAMMFLTTRTETEALLLEQNRIKQLKPRYNVLLRDDKSFPNILVTRDHPFPMIRKHRGAKTDKGDYYGPFASAGAVNRTLNQLQKAFLLRNCTDASFAARTRPCLLYQIRRCSAPCTGLISKADYARSVADAALFLQGRSTAVQEELATQMAAAAEVMEFERAAALRDRIRALTSVQTAQGINPRGVAEADVIALHMEGGQACVQVFFIRANQSWGNRDFYPKTGAGAEEPEIMEAFLAQFYDDKEPPPLVLLSHPLVGRLWCAFCPFMVWGELAQRLARRLGHQPARWPRGESDPWAAPVLAGGFAAILLWEALADLPNSGWQSSALLLLITAGAVVGSLRFEKRFWCRYLCPVGGMNGLFAKLAISELRAQAGTCSGSCTSYACFKGGPAEGEGLATAGCPLGTHPAHLTDNRNCVLCLTCVQACPHRSVQLRLRPPAADLQRSMDPPEGEVGLILVLAGGVCLHHWQRLLGALPLAPLALDNGPLLPRLAWGTAALALPAALFLLTRALLAWRGLGVLSPSRGPSRLRLGLYAGLPLLWALLLADHLPLGMAEAGRLLPVSLSPWYGELASRLPAWSADRHVIAFCQSTVVLLGLGGTLVLLRRLLLPSRWRGLALSGLALGLAAAGRWLVALQA